MQKLTRRRFVISVGASFGAASFLAGCPAPPPVDDDGEGEPKRKPGPEPEDPWEPAGAVDEEAFAWGVQVGDVTAVAALLSLQTLEEATDLVVARGVAGGWEEIARHEGLAADEGHVALELTDLSPDTTYAIAFYDAGGERRSAVGRFRTALYDDVPRVVRFGASCCVDGNRPWPSFSRAAEEKLDFFLLLGDTVYADAYANDEVRGLWRSTLAERGLRDLTSSTSVVATWDDHEVTNNWSWETAGMASRVGVCLQEFRRHLPQRLGRGEAGIWRKLSWGSVLDVFVLDSRGERRDGNYISPEQLGWLKDELSASGARFKIIANSVPIADFTELAGNIGADDRWQGYPVQREELLGHIDDEGIGGVLWVSGDFHIGGVGRVGDPGHVGADQWEVLAGPGGSAISVVATLAEESERFPILIDQWNSAIFEADAEAGTIHLKYLGDDGGVLREHLFEL